MANALRLQNYLTRIGYTGPLEPSLQTLNGLHAAHAAKIPFEGLDPFCRRPVSLDLESLQSKLVDSRRGGYCFEQNTLFKAALEAVGFRVTPLGGRVRWMSPPDSPLGPREHMLLKVDLPEGPYIADVGFGACVMDSPLRLELGTEQRTDMGTFRLQQHDGHIYLSAKQPKDWRIMYAFDLVPQLPSDADLGNWYSATHPRLPFQNMIIIERVDSDTRHKLINRRYIREARDGEVRDAQVLTRAEDWERILEDVFGIVPPLPIAEVFPRVPADDGH